MSEIYDPARHSGVHQASNAEMGEHLPGDQSLGTSFQDDRSTPPKTGRSHRSTHPPVSTVDKNSFTLAREWEVELADRRL